MSKKLCAIAVVVLTVWLAADAALFAAQAPEASPAAEEDLLQFEGGIGRSMKERADRVGEDIASKARTLFVREPLGWNLDTLHYLYRWGLELPAKIPGFVAVVLEQGRVLGAAGSALMLVFITAVLYSLIGRKRVLARVETALQPFVSQLPEAARPYFLSLLKVLVAALIPLLLLGAFALVNALIAYEAAWFRLVGRFLTLWAIGALVIGLLREALTQNLFPRTARYGKRIFALSRLAVIYVLAAVAVVWTAQAFPIRQDVVALLKFVISLSIVGVLFLLHLMKKALISLLPDLPNRSYQAVVQILERFYYPIIAFAFLTALLWCIGYRNFGRTVLLKIWVSGAAYVLIMWGSNTLKRFLDKWYAGKDPSNETAQVLFRALAGLLRYAAFTATILIVLNLLGLLGLLQQILSFPIAKLSGSPISLWIIAKALLILMLIVYLSRLLRAYLDYQIYPSLGVDSGLGYALNTSLNYTLLVAGALISLAVVGIDLRFMLVFAGAAGIGIGLGLQSMAANVISGFSIIFGGKVRKGDWVEVAETLGVVTDIHLTATRIKTRDDVEYLIPNANFISNTIINYSLSSPMVRISVPVGVSYNANPREVERILLEAAAGVPEVLKRQPPVVRFVEYADSAINFELLFWIDVRQTPRRKVRSELYFAIFEALKQAGIEIPFPQRDLHIRSSELQSLR